MDDKTKAPVKEVAKDKAAVEPSKADVPGKIEASNYSRGEGQKPVSQAYKDNWNDIYGKKKKKR